MDELTLSAYILAGAAVHDGCPVTFVTGDEEQATTLGGLVSDAEKLAAALQDRGIGSGDVVAVQLPGSYEGAVVQAAVGLSGAVLLPVVMIYGPREMDFVLRQSGATAVVLPREHRGRPHAGTVLAGLSALPALKLAVVVDAALNAAAFLPGRWFRTGDVGRLDADGYLTVTDRLKDIIIRGGENISSKEVEDLLITHPAVADVAVIPAPDPVMGERVCAVIVLRPGFSFDIDEARAHFAAAGAARQKTPEVIAVVAELPRTPSGKVRKEVLRARVASTPAGDAKTAE